VSDYYYLCEILSVLNHSFIFAAYSFTSPITVAERSKACIVFARSEAGMVGSNPTQGMDV
jgi:hypothetical protein